MMRFHASVLAVFAIALMGLCAAQSHDSKFIPCKAASVVHEVSINPCKAFPCAFSHSSSNVTVNLTVSEPVTVGNVKLDALLGGLIPVAYPGFEQVHFCKQLVGASCPLKAGQTVLYRSTLTIPKNVPLGPLPSTIRIKWQVQDAKENDIMCFESEVAIAKGGASNPIRLV